MRWYWKVLIGFVTIVILLANGLFSWVDRTPYTDTKAYQQTLSALDRYYEYRPSTRTDSLEIGWSSVSLIPSNPDVSLPLAGYGARDPKIATGILDSVDVRTIVITNGDQKVALVSAELLIVHPEVAEKVYSLLRDDHWSAAQIYFGATHTHASLGGWGPGVLGELFAGSYNPDMVDHLGKQIAASIQLAEASVTQGGYSFMEVDIPYYIINRLVKDQGITDPLLKATVFHTEKGKAMDLSYGAHATCFNHQWTELSGDYPSILSDLIQTDADFDHVSFRAGAVGSMGAKRNGTANKAYAQWMAEGIYNEMHLPLLLQPQFFFAAEIEAYQLPLYLEPPQLKITNNLRIRPWLFRQLVGEYPVNINVFSIDSLLMVGLPCDFSGELAVPLYEYARSKNLTLMIHSFNGGYIGYVPADRWYNLNSYETRTMAWYGHDMGAYLTEIIQQIINHHAL